MTPHVAAARTAHLCNAAASGDSGARAELGKFISAIEFFNEETLEVFIGALADGTAKYLIDQHGVGIANMNRRLASLLTGCVQ